MRQLSSFAFALVLAVTAAAPAAAQEDARALFLRGQSAYDTGDYQAAIDFWTQAYQLDPRPLLQFNLAQAYERLGQLEQAIQAYQTFIQNAPPDDQRQSPARARVARLRERVAATGILIRGAPDGAAVLIDGEDVGRLPRPDPFRVSSGSHQIIVRAPGYEDFSSVVAVSSGQTLEVPVSMTAGSRTVTPVAPGGGGGGGGPSVVGIIVAAAGLAIVGGGVVTGILALDAANSSTNGMDSDADSAQTLGIVTDILIPTGAVAVAAGLVLMFVLQDGGGGSSAQVTPLLGPDLAGVAVTGAF